MSRVTSGSARPTDRRPAPTVRFVLRRARDEPAVSTFRGTIAPDNLASMATIAGFGFREVGEQDDPEDGLEIIYEVPV